MQEQIENNPLTKELSIGAIVSMAAWEAHKANLEQFELIPSFDNEKELVPLNQELLSSKPLVECRVCENLHPIQKQWVSMHTVNGWFNSNSFFPLGSSEQNITNQQQDEEKNQDIQI